MLDGKYIWIDGKPMLNVVSANYLGLYKNPVLIKAYCDAITKFGSHPNASRISYKCAQEEELEEYLCELFKCDRTLFFQTTALVSMGVLSGICFMPDDVIIFDQYAHRTVQKAAQLTQSYGVQTIKFPHNDVGALERILQQCDGKNTIVIAVDGIYSMTGNYNDLREFDRLARKYNAFLYIDDAHGFAVMGGGRGVVGELGLSLDNSLYVGSFQKSIGGYGSFITCNNELAEFLKVMAFSYTYGGPVATGAYAFNLVALKYLETEGASIRAQLFDVTTYLISGLRDLGYHIDNITGFPIVCPVFENEQTLLLACNTFWEKNILMLPVCYPAVPKGKNLFRITPNAIHDKHDMDRLLEVFSLYAT